MQPTLLCPRTSRNITKGFFDLAGTTAVEIWPLWARGTAWGKRDRLGEEWIYLLHTPRRDSEKGLAASSSCREDDRAATTVPYKSGHLASWRKEKQWTPTSSCKHTHCEHASTHPCPHTDRSTATHPVSPFALQETKTPICSSCTAPIGAVKGKTLAPSKSWSPGVSVWTWGLISTATSPLLLFTRGNLLAMFFHI